MTDQSADSGKINVLKALLKPSFYLAVSFLLIVVCAIGYFFGDSFSSFFASIPNLYPFLIPLVLSFLAFPYIHKWFIPDSVFLNTFNPDIGKFGFRELSHREFRKCVIVGDPLVSSPTDDGRTVYYAKSYDFRTKTITSLSVKDVEHIPQYVMSNPQLAYNLATAYNDLFKENGELSVMPAKKGREWGIALVKPLLPFFGSPDSDKKDGDSE